LGFASGSRSAVGVLSGRGIRVALECSGFLGPGGAEPGVHYGGEGGGDGLVEDMAAD
jgi:hypothetical protein